MKMPTGMTIRGKSQTSNVILNEYKNLNVGARTNDLKLPHVHCNTHLDDDRHTK